jgi:hypothetical protein
MLKKHMAACLVATALMSVPALAQTSTSPGAPPPSPGASGGTSSGSGGAAGAGHFITQQQSNQWRASKLIGVNVYGSDNERIGDINEVLVDRQGNADAVVIGIGGFLGIGEKNVALPFNAFEWSNEPPRTASSSGSGGSGSAGGSSGGSGSTASSGGGMASSGSGGGAATTGSTSSASGSGSGSGSSARDRGYPDHAVLRMTKADLQNAPNFNYAGDNSSGGSGGGGAGRSSGAGAGAGGGAATGGAGGSGGTAR